AAVPGSPRGGTQLVENRLEPLRLRARRAVPLVQLDHLAAEREQPRAGGGDLDEPLGAQRVDQAVGGGEADVQPVGDRLGGHTSRVARDEVEGPERVDGGAKYPTGGRRLRIVAIRPAHSSLLQRW